MRFLLQGRFGRQQVQPPQLRQESPQVVSILQYRPLRTALPGAWYPSASLWQHEAGWPALHRGSSARAWHQMLKLFSQEEGTFSGARMRSSQRAFVDTVLDAAVVMVSGR